MGIVALGGGIAVFVMFGDGQRELDVFNAEHADLAEYAKFGIERKSARTQRRKAEGSRLAVVFVLA